MDVNACQSCQQVSASKRNAIAAVPLTVANPKWLARFRANASAMLLQRDFSMARCEPEEEHIGEVWFTGSGTKTDEEIIEAAAKAADWMRWKTRRETGKSYQPVVNAFAAAMLSMSTYENGMAAVKVERDIPNLDLDRKVGALRNSMPDMCKMHAEYAALLAENARLKRGELAGQTREYVKLATAVAKAGGETLTGMVRIVTFDGGKAPVQGEVFKRALSPMVKRDRGAELALIANSKITRI